MEKSNYFTDICQFQAIYGMILLKLPKELCQMIFLMLDGVNLHKARQVCKDWNKFIVQQIWNSRVGRTSLETRLNHNWKLGEPTKSEELLTFDDNKAYLLGMSEQYLAVKVMRESSRRITRRQKMMMQPTFQSVMIIVNLENKERHEILIDKSSDYSLDRVYFMSSIVIGELKSSWGLSLGHMRAWNIESQEEIFSKEYPTQFALLPQYDVRSQEIVLNSMVQSNPSIVRLKTEDDLIHETFFESSNIGGIVAFSSPYILCHKPSMEITFNLLKIVEKNVELVSTLEIPDLYFNKLTISNSYIVKVTSRPSRIISIWRLNTGELIKKINPPLSFTLESPSLSGTLLSYNHFILRFSYSCCRRKQLLLVYDIEELVTQSKFKPRQFIIDDFHRFGDSLEAGCMIINQNKTKLLVSDEYGGDIKFYFWDFWKCISRGKKEPSCVCNIPKPPDKPQKRSKK